MATQKSQQNPIDEQDVISFLEQESDFAFEMQVLKTLTSKGLLCDHGGTYHDPKTDKVRQFDIRARQHSGYIRIIWAIECKNIRSANPILAHLVRRNRIEAFNEVIIGDNIEIVNENGAQKIPRGVRDGRFRRQGDVVSVREHGTIYPMREWVAKSVDQISKDSNGNFKSNDAQFFDKSSQALSSSYDLIKETLSFSNQKDVHFVIPVLVVPDNRIWGVEYGEKGERSSPKEIASFESYVNWSWSFDDLPGGAATFNISHLEVTGISQLEKMISRFTDSTYLNHLHEYALAPLR